MKTYHLKDLLKKELLIIELPENKDIDFYEHGRELLLLTKGYIQLGKPDEISEEDVKELVENQTFGICNVSYKDYKLSKGNARLFGRSATESLLSAIETVIFWDVNPLDEPSDEIGCECEECQEDFEIKYNDFMIAQEKTFDKNRTIIFKKNAD